MQPEDSFAELMTRLKAGDDTAAAEVLHRFTHRLIGLARLRLGALAAARDDLARSVQADAEEANSWGLLALAEARLGHHPEAYAALARMTWLKAGGGAYPARPMPADLERATASLILDIAFPDDPFAR